jgi:hypothetical protein
MFIFNNNKIKNDIGYDMYIEIAIIYLILPTKVKEFFGGLPNIKPDVAKEQKNTINPPKIIIIENNILCNKFNFFSFISSI